MKEIDLITKDGTCYDRNNHKVESPFNYYGIEIDCVPPKGAKKVFKALDGKGLELTYDDGESSILVNWLCDVFGDVGIDIVLEPHRLIVVGNRTLDLTEI